MIDFDFDKIVNKAAKGFENKVRDRLSSVVDRELSGAGLPSFSELSNIKKNTYEQVLRNHNFELNLNEVPIGTTWESINNALHIGLGNKSAANQDAKNNPVNSTKSEGENVPAAVLKYPLGSDEERIPYMKISGFKYVYDSADEVGNKVSEAKGAQRTATIYLPLPGNLASGMSLQYEDYSSFFAKLVRAHNNAGDPNLGGILASLQEATGGVESEVWKDAMWAGGAAGLFSAGMGEGIGAAAAATVDEAFKYIRVQGGIAVNPMSQASYVGANIRTHSFEFHMVPRNANEAVECKKIIEMLQYCSIGERAEMMGGLIVNFPSVWNVGFFNYNDKAINGMLEIPDSFITEVNVTYSPTRAGFTVTQDNDPFAYVITLTFKEAQNLIRDDLSYIRQGGDLLEGMHPKSKPGDGLDFTKYIEIVKRVGENVVDTATGDNNDPAGNSNPAFNSGYKFGTGVREVLIDANKAITSQDTVGNGNNIGYGVKKP